MKLFIPITKVDATKREVYGRMVQEVPDSAGEIFDYESSKPNFEAWSQKFSDATDGKSLGNVRAMHQPIAAGKITQMAFDDDDKAIDICAKVVDDAEWDKVDQGLYTGFSIGGEYVKRWNDGTLKRYTANPKEVSLVDSPAVPTATFSMIKADGSTEERTFAMTTKTQVAAVDVLAEMLNKGEITPERLIELAKADKPAPAVETKAADAGTNASAAETKPAVSETKVEKTETVPAQAVDQPVAKADKPQAEADKVAAHNARIETQARALCKAETQNEVQWMNYVAPAIRELKKADAPAPIAAPAKEPAAPVTDPKPATEIAKTEKPVALKKGLWDVKQLADVLMSLAYCAMSAEDEAGWEGDDSKVPDQLKAAAAAVGQALKDMTTEEVDELIADMVGDDDDAMMAPTLMMAERMGALAKAGARNSKADLERVQKIHDAAADLGAKCDKADVPMDTSKSPDRMPEDAGNKGVTATPVKADAATDLSKGDQFKTVLEKLAKFDDMVKTIDELTARLKKVEDMPMPPKGALRVISKDDEVRGDQPQVRKIESTPGQHNPDAALALIKESVVATSGIRKF